MQDLQRRMLRTKVVDRAMSEARERITTDVQIGVSTCLLGERVRHDGGHKRDPFVVETLARRFRLVPVCPEVEIGLGTPREPIRLLRQGADTRLVGVDSGRDQTDRMKAFARRRVSELAALDIDGYVLKSASPSCGLREVAIYLGGGRVRHTGRGLFAGALIERLPLLPVEDEGRLRDAAIRESFIERVLAYRRVKTLFAGRWIAADLVRFHEREQMRLLAHDARATRALDRLVARAHERPRRESARRYMTGFMKALAKPPTRRP